jgi:hypothetical protein
MQRSYWTEFPAQYKFISYQVNINDIKKKINRETKDVMRASAEFGGLLAAIKLLFTGFF